MPLSSRTIFRNSLYLFTSDVVVRLVSTIATIALARYLGPSDYGIYSVAFALAGIVGFLSDLGTGQTYLRERTRVGCDEPILVASFFKVRAVFALLATVLALLLISGVYRTEPLRTVCLIIVIPTIWGATLNGFASIFFSARQEMQYVAGIRSFMSLTQAAAIIAGVSLGWSLQKLALVPGLSLLASGLLGYVLVRRNIGRFSGWNAALLEGLWLFSLAGIMGMLAPQLGPLTLERVTTLEEVGLFAAVYRIPAFLMQIPMAISSAFYPQMFKAAHENAETHLALGLREFRVVLLLSAGLALPFALQSEWVVDVIFGSRWQGASAILSIMAWVVVFSAVGTTLAHSATTLGLQARRVKIQLVAMVFGITVYAWLGGHYGALGGAVAALVFECLAFAGYLGCNPMRREFMKRSMFTFCQVFAGIAAATVAAKLLPTGSEAAGVVLAPFVFYVFLLLCFREFRYEVKWLFSKGLRSS